MEDGRRQSVAIIGSGIAGLAAAYLLSTKYDVTIFEREERLGLDSQGIDLCEGADAQGRPYRVDSPPRSFSRAYYPHLMAMYELAGVAVEPFDWGYSLSLAGAPRAYLCVRERRLCGWRLPCFPGQLWRAFSPATARIVRDGLRYFRDVRRDAHDPDMCALSVGQYLAAKAYSSEYVDRVFLPLYSMILTCSFAAVLEYPMDIVMAYSLRAASDNQYHAAGGSWDASRRLAKAARRVELGATVTAVLHGDASSGSGGGAHPCVRWRRRRVAGGGSGSSGGGGGGSGGGIDEWAGAGDGKHEREDVEEEEEEFDHVVMATPAHSALGALPGVSSEEAAALSAFAYEESEVVVHRDGGSGGSSGGGGGGALLPRDARDVNSINFVTHAGARRCTATLLLPDPSRPGAVVYQSWNPPPDAQPAETIRRIRYCRSVVTLRTRAAVAALHACQGRGGVWFVGAYALDQVPLQEQGVRSAVAVADALGVRAPWAAHFTAAAARAAAAAAARGMTPLYNCGSGGSSSGGSGMSARALLNGHASRGGCACDCGAAPQCAEAAGHDTALRSEDRDGSAAAGRSARGKGEPQRCSGGAACAGHVADAAGRTLWMNWGLWRPLLSGAMPTYPQACEQLASLAGDAIALSPADRVLDVGCGAGDSLLTWRQRFGVRGVAAVEAVPSQAELARARFAAAADDDDDDAVAAAADVRQGCGTALPHADGAFTAVVSVDAVYHFASRGAFFAEANRVLKPGGRLAIIDLLLPSLAPSKQGAGLWCRGHRFLLSVAQSALRYPCRIPAANACAGVDQVLGQLARAGFSGFAATDITADTLCGFAAFTAARCGGFQCRSTSSSSSSSSKCSPNGNGDCASNCGGSGARRRCRCAARRSWALRLRWLPYRLLGAALAWLARRGALRCALITARKPGVAAAALAA